MSRVSATLFTDFDKLESGPPGGIQFGVNMRGDVCSLIHKCPCGCGDVASLRIGVEKPAESPSWKWNGNREKPTLEPSVYAKATCGYHGWLRDGVWETC